MKDFIEKTKEKIMKLFKTESGRLNALLAAIIVIAIVIVFLLNAVVHTFSERYPLSLDLTSNANYNIGDDSKEVLASLSNDITINVLADKGSFTGSPYLVQTKKIIEQYPKYSKYVTLKYVDYTTDPTFAAQYPTLNLSEGDILVVGSKNIKQIPLNNMFTYTYNSNQQLQVDACRAEEAITSAIVSVNTENPVYITILTGNAVSEDRQTLESILTDNNFIVDEKDLVTGDFSESDILFLLAPQQDLSEDVLTKLDEFLKNNGEYGRTIIYAADVNQPKLPNIDIFLREWGIEIDKGAVFETNENNVYGYQPYYPLVNYTDDTYIEKLKDTSKKVLLPLARPINKLYDFRDNKTVTQLLEFSETTGVRPEEAGDNFRSEDSVKNGPMPAMLLSTLQAVGATRTSQILAVPSVQAFESTVISNTSIANAEYLTAILNTVSQRENAISIEAKSLAGNILTITQSGASTWGVIFCIIIPVAILATGILIYLKRRYR